MRPRANLYTIDRIEYLPRATRYYVVCLVTWASILVIVTAFWLWCLR